MARGELTNGVELARQTAKICAAKDQWILEAMALYDAARLGEARAVAERLVELAGMVKGNLAAAMASHASALAVGGEAGLTQASETWESKGALLYAAEAAAEASRAAAAAGRKSTAMSLAARARSLAAHCEGARTPALADLDQPLPSPVVSARSPPWPPESFPTGRSPDDWWCRCVRPRVISTRCSPSWGSPNVMSCARSSPANPPAGRAR